MVVALLKVMLLDLSSEDVHELLLLGSLEPAEAQVQFLEVAQDDDKQLQSRVHRELPEHER